MLEYALFEELVKEVAKDKTIASRSFYPLVIDFSKEWHKYLVNWEELNAEVVDLSAEGIPKPYSGHSGKALKVTLNANETKILHLPIHYCNLWLYAFCTGSATITVVGSGSNALGNVQSSWMILKTVSHVNTPAIINLYGNANGGTVYIALIIAFKTHAREDDVLSYISPDYKSYPNNSYSGTSSSYSLFVECNNEAQIWPYITIAGDGTNALNVDLIIQTADGNKTVASISRVDSTPARYFLGSVPVKSGGIYPVYFTVQFNVSGYGVFKEFEVRHTLIKRYSYEPQLNGLKTASASNTSTTATTYTLIDNNGRGNRYKQASVSLSSPSGGTAKLYINGQLVADYSGSSGTFNIPDDLDIWKIEVELAGNGTTAATANFSGLELLGPYIVRR